MPSYDDLPGVPECRAFLQRNLRRLDQVAATLKWKDKLRSDQYVLVLFNPDVPACRRLAERVGARGSPPVHVARWPAERRLIAKLYGGDMRPFHEPISPGSARVLVVGSKLGRLIWDHGFALTAAELGLSPWPRREGSTLDDVCGTLFDEVPTIEQVFGDAEGRFWSTLGKGGDHELLAGLTLEQSTKAVPGTHPVLFVKTNAISTRDREPPEVFDWMQEIGGFDYEYRPAFVLPPRFADHLWRCDQLLADRVAWRCDAPVHRQEVVRNVRRGEHLVWLIHGVMPLPDVIPS